MDISIGRRNREISVPHEREKDGRRRLNSNASSWYRARNDTGMYRCPKVHRETRIHACVNSARGKIIIILRKQNTLIHSFARSQILCARDNYANTFPRWFVLRADNDKTQILTPTALKRENKGNSETGTSGTRAENIEKKPDLSCDIIWQARKGETLNKQ